MPVDIDVAITTRMWDVEDVNKFNKLPYYFAKMSARKSVQYSVWQKLYGTLPWTPKQGTTLRGVAQEPSPVTRQQFSPNAITAGATRDIITTLERTSDALVQRHKFESPQFHFLQEFQDFATHIAFNNADINRQIMVAQEAFLRTQALHKSPMMVIVGKTGSGTALSELTSVPHQTGIVDIDAASGKTTAFWKDAISKVAPTGGEMNLRAFHRCLAYISEDIQAEPFSSLTTVSKKDSPVADRYIMTGENSLYSNLIFDQEAKALMSADSNFLTNQFTGSLFNRLNFMSEQYPLRLDANGTFPVPEIIVSSTAGGDNHNQTIPNPDYAAAPFGIAFITGANAYRAISVGAPPAAFAGQSMSEGRFNKLNWNGRARLTDNVLINYGGGIQDVNNYGEVMKFIADATFAALAQTSRFCIPVLYRRNRFGSTDS